MDSLRDLGPNVIGYASVGAIAILALVMFRIARRVVMLGYFVLYFLIGFAIVFTAGAYSTRSLQVPLSMPIVGGLAFAAVANAIRSKLMRIVSVTMLVALFSLGGRFWSEYADREKKAPEQNSVLAEQGLAAARRDFNDIARLLPKDKGKIAPGWIPADALSRAGIHQPLHKVEQKPVWHTWLTGLYDQENEDLGVWTSGGTLEEAKKSLQLKVK